MDWVKLFEELVYVVITAAVPVLTYYLARYLDKLFNKIKQDTNELAISNTVNETMNLIIEVVLSTSQTYVDALKKEGKFNKEAQEKAFNITKDTIMSLLSKETYDILEALYLDVDKWLDVQIESAVRNTKN